MPCWANWKLTPRPPRSDDDPGRLRLLLLAGRRMTPLVDVHSGLLPGWNGRSRGWWSEQGETPVTLLSLGICDVTGVVMGERCAFLEMFAAETEASQFVFIPDHPIAPAAPVLLDQLQRTPANFRAILADLHAGMAKSGSRSDRGRLDVRGHDAVGAWNAPPCATPTTFFPIPG